MEYGKQSLLRANKENWGIPVVYYEGFLAFLQQHCGKWYDAIPEIDESIKMAIRSNIILLMMTIAIIIVIIRIVFFLLLFYFRHELSSSCGSRTIFYAAVLRP